ncbi:MAG: hypothetical protein ACYDGM_08835 [Vulcanimicrobiaceae bacterium]
MGVPQGHRAVVRVSPHPTIAVNQTLPILAFITIDVLFAVAIYGIVLTTNRSKTPRPVVPAVLLTLLAIVQPFISPGAYVVVPLAVVLGVWLICAELRQGGKHGERCTSHAKCA